MTKEQEIILCDAQTSGGLLTIVRKDAVAAFKELTQKHGLDLNPIGYTHEAKDKLVYVK